jgi:hypothetical protein
MESALTIAELAVAVAVARTVAVAVKRNSRAGHIAELLSC